MNLGSIGFPAVASLSSVDIVDAGDGLLSMPCPCCGSPMLFKGDSGKCTSPAPCGFRAGSPIDFLAYRLQGFGAAVRAAYPTLTGMELHEMAVEHTAQRAVLEEILRLQANQNDGMPERMGVLIYAERVGATNRLNPLGVLATTSAETGRLFELLMLMGAECPPQMTGPCLIIPFWNSHHEIASLYIEADRGRRTFRVQVNPSKWSFTGLPQMHQSPGEMIIYPNQGYILAAALEASGSLSSSRLCLVFTDPTESKPGWAGDSLVFGGTPSEWLQCFPKWSILPGFGEAHFLLEGRRVGLEEAIMQIVATFGGVDPEVDGSAVLAMLGGMMLSQKVAAGLIESFYNYFGPRWAEDAGRVLTRRLLMRRKNTSYYAGPKGYESVTGSVDTHISNFTLALEDAVAFSPGHEVIYRVKVTIKTTDFEVAIPSASLDAHAALQQEIQSHQILGVGPGAKAELATVKDPKGFKEITRYLKEAVPSLPRVRGTRLLGWTLRRDEYHTPGLAIRGGSEVEAIYIPDETTSFYQFNSKPHSEDAMVVPSNIVLRGLAAAMVANMVRAYLDLPFVPEPAVNDTPTRTALTALFAELGQTAPVHITSTLPRYLAAVNGHPVLATGLNALQAQKVKINGVYLSDKGARLEGTSEEEAAAAGRSVLCMLRNLAKKLTAGASTHYPERRSVALDGRAAIEGAELIRNEFGLDWEVPCSRYRYVDLLMEQRKEMLDAAARIAEEDIVIPIDVVKGIADPGDLAIELSLLCAKVEVDAKGIRLDQISYSQIYERYYGVNPPLPAPKLPDIFTPA